MSTNLEEVLVSNIKADILNWGLYVFRLFLSDGFESKAAAYFYGIGKHLDVQTWLLYYVWLGVGKFPIIFNLNAIFCVSVCINQDGVFSSCIMAPNKYPCSKASSSAWWVCACLLNQRLGILRLVLWR